MPNEPEPLNYNYKITTETEFSPLQIQILEEGRSHAHKARPAGEKQLQRLIKRYPRLPQLQNYLSTYYRNIGKMQLAHEVNDGLLKAFPDYFHARVNKAHQLLQDGNPEAVMEMFPPSFNLKIMYPEKDSFHISQVFEMAYLAVMYFIETKEYDQAEIHLEMLKKLDFDAEAVDELEMAILTSRSVDRAPKKSLTSVGKEIPEISDSQPPKFNLKETQLLFADEELSESELQSLADLPRKDLTEDLKTIFQDAVVRFQQHLADEEYNFILNALLLAGKIRAKECLPEILEFLSQNEKLLEYYLDDYLTEIVWEVLFFAGNENISELQAFVINPQNYTYAKSEVVRALAAIYIIGESRRSELKAAFKTILDYYNHNVSDDSSFLGLFVSSLDDCGLFPDFKFEIKQLYDAGKVDENVGGNFEELSKTYNSELRIPEFQFLS